jgi:hypothetical protein
MTRSAEEVDNEPMGLPRITTLTITICIIGVSAVGVPVLVTGSNAISYLQATKHGKRSTTTTAPAPAIVPRHRWTNELPRAVSAPDSQIQPIIPDNAGTP